VKQYHLVPFGTPRSRPRHVHGLRFTGKVFAPFYSEKQDYWGTKIKIPVRNRRSERKIQESVGFWQEGICNLACVNLLLEIYVWVDDYFLCIQQGVAATTSPTSKIQRVSNLCMYVIGAYLYNLTISYYALFLKLENDDIGNRTTCKYYYGGKFLICVIIFVSYHIFALISKLENDDMGTFFIQSSPSSGVKLKLSSYNFKINPTMLPFFYYNRTI
jgi:hypothetical protein